MSTFACRLGLMGLAAVAAANLWGAVTPRTGAELAGLTAPASRHELPVRALAAPAHRLFLPAVPLLRTVAYAEVGHIGGRSNAVAVAGHRLYVGDGPQIAVLSAADPTDSAVLGRSPVLAGQIVDVSVVGDVAFALASSFGDGGTTLHALDVSTPSAQREVGRMAFDGGHLGRQKDRMVVDGGRAYVAFGDVAVAQGLAYVSGTDLRIVDVGDPGHPRLLGQAIPRRGYSAWDIHVVDVSDPLSPRVASTHTLTGGFAGAIAAAGRTVYATECNDGDASWYGSRLIVLDATIPDAPRETARLELRSPAVWASIAGDRLYVATGGGITSDRVTVFDISATTSPRQLQQVEEPRLGDVALAAGEAYAVEEHGPVHV